MEGVAGNTAREAQAVRHPTFAEAFRFWLKLGFISFGGPTGQIAIMHSELVEKRRWISDNRFLHALNFCMLLPGPEAQQLATYIGWLLHRTWGGIVAGALFVIPSMFILWALSFVYVKFGAVPWVAAIFYGLKPAVLAIVGAAVIRIGRKALKNEVMWALAAAAFIALYFFKVPFPMIVMGAALAGFLGGKLWKEKFLVINGHGARHGSESIIDDHSVTPEHCSPSLSRAIAIIVVGGLLWWLPIVAAGLWLGWEHTLFQEGLFFSKASMVTFGGAYAVLPYVSQQAVEHYQWLNVTPFVISELRLEEIEGAGGAGPAGGVGGGRRGNGAGVTERLHYMQVAPTPAPAAVAPTPVPPPPVVPPPTESIILRFK
jgi:chromate transporter